MIICNFDEFCFSKQLKGVLFYLLCSNPIRAVDMFPLKPQVGGLDAQVIQPPNGLLCDLFTSKTIEISKVLLLMEEILHRLGCIKPGN